ncbi:hypothetical protein FRC09_017699 [Ceratobasidium sp. 395]|nr:hypothetical protein FRC09_017699 [Ceratobasidium sp. 395]
MTDLRLVFSCSKGDFPISTMEFTEILMASPELETLKLENLEVFETENWGRGPITMSRLGVLNLVRMDPDCLQLLLPLITLSGPLPEISLGITVSSQMRDEFEAFLVRSEITTLYCTEHEDSYSESFPLPSRQLLGDLRILVLDNVSIAEMMSGGASRRTSQPSPHPLSTTLLYCTVNLDTLKAFILDYDIRFLRFEICQLDPVAKDDFQDLSGLRYSLLKTFPELDCTISDEGSAWDLACCKMYDSPI